MSHELLDQYPSMTDWEKKWAFTLDGSQSTTWCHTLCCHRRNEVLNLLFCVPWYSTLHIMCGVSFVICLMKAHFLSYLPLGPVKSVRARSKKERGPKTSYLALMLWSSNLGPQWTVTPCSHPAAPVDLVSQWEKQGQVGAESALSTIKSSGRFEMVLIALTIYITFFSFSVKAIIFKLQPRNLEKRD